MNTNTNTNTNTVKEFRAHLAGQTVDFDAIDFEAVVTPFVQANGGGVPHIEQIGVVKDDVDRHVRVADVSPISTTPGAGFSGRGLIHMVGRVSRDVRGVMRHLRMPRSVQPIAVHAFESFGAVIDAEQRRDRSVCLKDLRMTDDGEIEVSNCGPRAHRVAITQRAFKQLLGARVGISGGGYLSECWPELRAHNFNAWVERVTAALETPEDGSLVLRVRNRRDATAGREIYAAVTERYQGGLDAGTIARALVRAVPEDAFGELFYDGQRARFHFEQHASEWKSKDDIFRSGVSIATDDTGGGSIRVHGTITRAVCSNLMIWSSETLLDTRIRHTGDLDALVAAFQSAFCEAINSVRKFNSAWDRAHADRIVETVAAPADVQIETMTATEVLNGIFWAQLRHSRELVGVRGNRREIVSDLVETVMRDPSRPSVARDITRATIVNGWTRYAHEIASADPWVEDLIEREAARMVKSTRPLLFEPLPA